MKHAGRYALAVTAVLVVILVAARRRGVRDEAYGEGAVLTVSCGAKPPRVLRAEYGPPSGPGVDVTRAVAAILARGEPLTVSAAVLGAEVAPINGEMPVLRLRYRCGGGMLRDGFVPVPELICGLNEPPEYAVDETGRGAPDSVVWEPFAGGRRDGFRAGRRDGFRPRSIAEIAAEADAPAGASIAGPVRLGPTPLDLDVAPRAFVRALVRGTSAPGGRTSAVSNSEGLRITGARNALSDINSDMISDGGYDVEVLYDTDAPVARGAPGRAWGRPIRQAEQNVPVPLRMGLGSIRSDPRFQPGRQGRVFGGDGQPAPGVYAGGETLGALAPDVFAPGAAWDVTPVRAFGEAHLLDGRRYPVARYITRSA